MTKRELIEGARRALAAFDALPPEEQVRELIAYGTINEKGEVLLGVAKPKVEPQPKEGERNSGPANEATPRHTRSGKLNREMSKKELLERTRQALAEFDALPPEEQVAAG